MDALLQDVRYALRALGRSPGFAVVAIVSLALGIGPNTAMYTLVNGLWFPRLQFEHEERLVDLSEDNKAALCDGCGVGTSYDTFREWRAETSTFSGVGAYREEPYALADGEGAEHVSGAIVSANLFDVVGTRIAIGRGIREDEDRPGGEPVVLISDRLWRRKFAADSGVVGKQLRLNGTSYTVVGVMPPRFALPERSEVWIAMGPKTVGMRRDDRSLTVLARLADGVSPSEANERMALLGRSLEKGWTARAIPLVDGLRDVQIGSIFLLLLGASGFVVAIACANLAGLQLSRGAGRTREIAVRRALGASRGRVIRQMLTESVLLGLAGGTLGIVLAVWGVDAGVALIDEPLPYWIDFSIGGKVLAFAAGVSVLAGVAFGLIPALRISDPQLQGPLKEGGTGSGGPQRQRARGILVVAEMALALILLAGAGLMIKSFAVVSRQDNLGYDPRNVLGATIRLAESRYDDPAQRRQASHQLVEQLTGVPGVTATAVEATEFLGTFDRPGSRVSMEGKVEAVPNDLSPRFGYSTSPDYFRMMGMRIVRGRPYDANDRAGSAPVVLLSERAAKQMWPDEDAIGKRIRVATDSAPGEWLTVIGVVGDVIGSPLGRQPSAVLYRPYDQAPLRPVSIRLRAERDPLALSPTLRAAVKSVDPDQPVDDLMTMQQSLTRWVRPIRFVLALLSGLAVLALLLAAVGIYGMMAYSVAQRRREIGIRIALGAAAGAVVQLIVRGGVKLTVIALVIGLAGSLALARLLRSVLFTVSPSDPVVFSAVALVLGGVALLACFIPARRATLVDPVVVLRSE